MAVINKKYIPHFVVLFFNALKYMNGRIRLSIHFFFYSYIEDGTVFKISCSFSLDKLHEIA